MCAQYKVSGYHITTDPDFYLNKKNVPPELSALMADLYFESQDKKNKKIVEKLKGLIIKYPQSPQLKNYLSAAYKAQGKHAQGAEINRRILAEHPDYLFAKLNLAYEHIGGGDAAKVPEILGASLELKDLYPDRELFHLAEVTGYYRTAISYYAAVKNYELAESKFEDLKKIAPSHPDTEFAEDVLLSLRLEKNMILFEEANAATIKVICAKPIPVSNATHPPVFHSTEINHLYSHGLQIPFEKLQQILLLPYAPLVEDLEKILLDSENRYVFFKDSDGDEATTTFPLHAICLLGELNAENSLPAILNLLENNGEVLNFWFGDHLTETIWLPVYRLSQDKLDLLKQFLLKPGIHTYAKVVITEVLKQIALHQPARSNEVAAIFEEVFSYLNHAAIKDNIIDSDFLGLTIGDAIDCGFTVLLPVIKELFDKGRVSLSVCGTYEEVMEFFQKPQTNIAKNDILTIFELYENINANWTYRPDNYRGLTNDSIQEPVTVIKIGRNDPCPCGSGKKYKKCCLGELPA